MLKTKTLETLKKRQQELDHMLQSLDHASTWEHLAREQLYMIKPGEIAYRFYDQRRQQP